MARNIAGTRQSMARKTAGTSKSEASCISRYGTFLVSRSKTSLPVSTLLSLPWVLNFSMHLHLLPMKSTGSGVTGELVKISTEHISLWHMEFICRGLLDPNSSVCGDEGDCNKGKRNVLKLTMARWNVFVCLEVGRVAHIVSSCNTDTEPCSLRIMTWKWATLLTCTPGIIK